MKRKSAKNEANLNQETAPVSPALVWFKKWWKVLVPSVLLLIIFITLMTCFIGIRGVYVNVDDPNEFYSFTATNYYYEGFGNNGEPEGTWKIKDDTLILKYKDYFTRIKHTNRFPFAKKDNDTFTITDNIEQKTFKRVSLVGYHAIVKKVNVKFDPNGGTINGSTNSYTKTIKMGNKVGWAAEPTPKKENHTFWGWYSTVDGRPYDYFLNVWEDITYYALWDRPIHETFDFSGNDDGTYTVRAKYNDIEGDITIPSSFNGIPVTRIDKQAFLYCGKITSITVPDSVTSIGESAFYGLSNLTSVTLGNGVTSIGDSAFFGCSALKNINLPDSLTSIGKSAFSGCYELTSIVIPRKVESISEDAFYYCSKLANVTIPNGVTSIDKSAFQYCGELTSVTIPESVNSICEYAFFGCNKLLEIYNLSNLEIIKGKYDNGHIGIYAKAIHTSLNEPSRLTTTNDGYVFYEDENEVCLVSYVGTETALTLPDNYNGKNYAISECAFWNYDWLTGITIPSSVIGIGDWSFYGCENLQYNEYDNAFYLGNKDNPYIVLIKAKSNDISSCSIHSQTKFILNNAFSKCKKLTGKIVVPDTVKSIGAQAFYECSGLENVIIGNNVTSIGFHAFDECSGLTSVTIGNGVTYIAANAFSVCYRLVEIYNLSNLEIIKGKYDNGHIGVYAKAIHTSLNEPSRLTTTNDGYVFYEDENEVCLVSYVGKETVLNLPDNFNGKDYVINDMAFCDFDVLTSVTISGGVTSIERNAFAGCSKLASVIIGDNVTSIETHAFDKCSGLTSVTIGNSVTDIFFEAFSGCSGLTSIVIPDSVTYMAWAVFNNCIGLKTIYCEAESEPYAWHDDWLENCKAEVVWGYIAQE